MINQIKPKHSVKPLATSDYLEKIFVRSAMQLGEEKKIIKKKDETQGKTSNPDNKPARNHIHRLIVPCKQRNVINDL